MHSSENSSGYLLLFRGTDWHLRLSPEEIQQTMDQWTAWFDGLTREGKLVSGRPLENDGKVVSGASRLVADGPFSEAKEAIGGFFLLNVETIDEAVAIARNCPALAHGLTVEVRPVAPMCPAERLTREARDHAVA